MNISNRCRGKKITEVGSRCNFFKARRGHQYQFGKCFIRFRPLQNSYQQPKRQGYGAIKTWEKKIFYDLLWPNEISDLNNFNTTTSYTPMPASLALDFPKTFFTTSAESIFSKCSHKNVPLLAHKE